MKKKYVSWNCLNSQFVICLHCLCGIFFFFKIFFCKHFILKNHKAADKLEEYSDDRMCPWHRVIWLHLHLTTHAPHFFLAQPFNIVAAITSRVFGWTEICYLVDVCLGEISFLFLITKRFYIFLYNISSFIKLLNSWEFTFVLWVGITFFME